MFADTYTSADADISAEDCADIRIDISTAAFVSNKARIGYAQRVAAAIVEAMQEDLQLATDAVLRGRVGLAEMSDRHLLETGVEAWRVLPVAGELRSARSNKTRA